MDKNYECAKCQHIPSNLCGECPVWLADAETSQEEIAAYRKGASDATKQARVDAINEFVNEINKVKFKPNGSEATLVFMGDVREIAERMINNELC